MTSKPANKEYVGKRGLWDVEGVQVEVRIVDHKYVFGRDDVLIEPVKGKGQKWVRANNVALDL